MEIYSEHFQRRHGAKDFLQGGLSLSESALCQSEITANSMELTVASEPMPTMSAVEPVFTV